jgi:hypothetical protein
MHSLVGSISIMALALPWFCASATAEPEKLFPATGKVISVTVTKPDVEKDATVGFVMLEGNPTPIRITVNTKIVVGDTSDLVGRSIGSIKKGQEIDVDGTVQEGQVTAKQIIIHTTTKDK